MTPRSPTLPRPSSAAQAALWLRERLPSVPPRVAVSAMLVGGLALLLSSATSLAPDAVAALVIFAAALAAWTLLGLPQSPVAIAAALAMSFTGAIDDDDLFEALGEDVIWLMLGAFVIAAVLRETGVATALTMRLLSRCRSVTGLFFAATAAISATAFVIPSTSARAAILVPVFAALVATTGDRRLARALGLLFPTVILLSAGASLTGAGAHLVALGFIGEVDGPEIGFLGWAVLAAPFALATAFLGCLAILWLFLDRGERAAAVRPEAAAIPLDPAGLRVLCVATVTVLVWCTQSLHGFGLAATAVAGALVAASRPVSGIAFKSAIKGVDWDLLVFLAATLAIGEGLMESGAAEWMAAGVADLLDEGGRPSAWLVVTAAAAVSALAHLVVISRTARATVLIPALALPLSGFGVDPALLIMVGVLGSGFCQSLLVSAKPVMMFAAGDEPPFSQKDLLRLAMALLPPFVALLALTALVWWPLTGFFAG